MITSDHQQNDIIDPEIFELLENEFLSYNFLDEPDRDRDSRNQNLFDLQTSDQFPEDIPVDLTPFPSFHSRNRNADRNPLLSTTAPTDFKFFCSLDSMSGLETLSSSASSSSKRASRSPMGHLSPSPWLPCFSSLSYLTLSLKILDETRTFLLTPADLGQEGSVNSRERGVFKLSPLSKKSRSSSASASAPIPQLWEFSDFCGSTTLEISLSENFSLGSHERILATRSISFAEFLQKQQDPKAHSNGDSWLLQTSLNLTPAEDTLHSGKESNKTRRRRSQNSSWWGSIQDKTRFSLVKGFSDQLRADSGDEKPQKQIDAAPISLKFSFRLIFLQSCLKSSLHAKSILRPDAHEDTASQIVSEFHLLVLKAPVPVLVETMKSLAWRGVLARALANPTSLGYWPLEAALLSDNGGAVLELLQRAGHLCIPPLLSRSSCPFHHCVRGNSVSSFGYISRFLKKYGDRGAESRRRVAGARTNGETMTFESCLEWRDENQHTPLTLACSLPNRLPIIKELLLLGADVSAVNGSSGRSAFTYLCANGEVEAVSTFLSLQDASSPLSNERPTRYGGNRRPAFEKIGCPPSLSHFPCQPDYREPASGKSAIHFAAEKGHAEVVLLLLGIAQSGSRDLIKKVIPIEKERYQHYRNTVLPQGYDNMSYALKPLLIRNNHGKLALDAALEHRDSQTALVLLEGMIDIYGDISPDFSSRLTTLKARLDAGECPSNSLVSLRDLRGDNEDDENSEGNGWQESEREEFDRQEYLFALTPLSFKTFQNMNS